MFAVAPALPLIHLPTDRLMVAYAILLGAIAYNVSVHGGRLTLESEPGRCSTFTITLPVAPTSIVQLVAAA